MSRAYVVTGAASGIGKATAELLVEQGHTVIGTDIRDADILADLSTVSGRDYLVQEVTRMSGGAIDAVLANDAASAAQVAEMVPMPLNGFFEPRGVATLLAWLTSEDNAHLCGQVIYIDGGSDAVLRGDSVW